MGQWQRERVSFMMLFILFISLLAYYNIIDYVSQTLLITVFRYSGIYLLVGVIDVPTEIDFYWYFRIPIYLGI